MPHIDLISLFIAPVWGLYVNYTSTLRDECASSFIACAYCFRRS